MMNYLFAGLIVLAAVWGICTGHSADVASAVLESGGSTVKLMLSVAGAMTMWNGLMAIADKSELTRHVAVFLRPLLRLVMPGLSKNGRAEKFVCMNIVANLLGLGNAATPLGLRAMEEIRREQGLKNGAASREMMTFAVINTASLQLLPATVLVLRTEAGAANPMEILPCVWLTSAAALTAGLLMCAALRGFFSDEAA